MAISGDLKALNLSELFQTLAGASQQGTLTVTDGARTKHFIFTSRGITLETSEAQLTARLGDILVARGQLTPEQLRQAEAKVQTAGGTLEDTLLELELASRRTIDQALRTQVEEEMYDVFAWDEARFEFQPGARGGGEERPKPKTRMLFNVSGLLMEAARRLDEWRLIHDVIPGLAAIVVPVGKLDPAAFTGAQRTAATLLDGERTVAQLCTEGHLLRFDTCKFLKELVAAGKAKLLDGKDLAARGSARIEQGDAEGGIALLRLALRLHPALHGHRLQLAEALEGLQRAGEAAAEYRRLARVKLLQHDAKQAVAIQTVACDLAPDDEDARAERFAMVVEHAEQLGLTPRELAPQALPFVRQLVAAGRTHDAEGALDRLAAKCGDQPDVWRLKVNLRLEAGDPPGAVEAYRRILPLLEAVNDRRGVREVLQNILKIAPEDTEARLRLEALESSVGVAPLVSGSTTAARPARRRRWVWVAALVVTVAPAGIIGWRELRARQAVAGALLAIDAQERAGDLRGAAKALRALAAQWPWTFAVAGLEARARTLELKAESP